MKNTFKSMIYTLAILSMGIYLTGCYATTHVVGSGGTYAGNDIQQYDLKKKKWYLLGGAIPLDDVSADKIAGDAKNYTARETFSFGDLIISSLTSGIAAPRTIRISKAADEK